MNEGRGFAGPGEGGKGSPECEEQLLHEVIPIGPRRENVRDPMEQAGVLPQPGGE